MTEFRLVVSDNGTRHIFFNGDEVHDIKNVMVNVSVWDTYITIEQLLRDEKGEVVVDKEKEEVCTRWATFRLRGEKERQKPESPEETEEVESGEVKDEG